MDVNYTSAAQLRAAVALAAAHGHEWARDGLDFDALDGVKVADAVRIIKAATDAKRVEGALTGIGYPEWDVDGDIVHETLTGRLTWLVGVDGRVVLCAWRPGDVLAMRVVVEVGGVVGDIEVTEQCHWRHLQAVGEAVAAVVGEPYPWLAHFPQAVVQQVFEAEKVDLLRQKQDLDARAEAVREEATALYRWTEALEQQLEDFGRFLDSGL